MNRHRVVAIALALLLPPSTLAMPTAASVETTAQARSDQSTTAVELVQRAFADARANHPKAAETELEKAIADPGFAQLPLDARYGSLTLAALLAGENGHDRKAHELALQATAFDQADDDAWMTRLSAAYSVNDMRDVAHCVAVLARRWPDRLGDLQSGLIWQVHHLLQQANAADADREMLNALFDVQWSPLDSDTGALWRDLALMLLQSRHTERATAVALRIKSAQTAISLLVDKRFDAITHAHPDAFDVDKLIAAQIAGAQAQVRAHPDELAPVTELQELYLLTQAYPQVLAISDAAVAHAERGDGAKAYTDFADRYNWILDNRSRALVHEGRWHDAVQTEILAARRPEQGSMNVSQLINLADLYADLGQADKAADTIVELGRMSTFGRMQLESVKLKIAMVRHDKAATAKAMTYLGAHRDDAIATWEDALLLRGNLDEAAQFLIQRLQKPEWRNAALVDMQQYASGDDAPLEKTIHKNWNTVIARADVQAELHKAGRVERFQIAAPLL